MAKGVPTAEGNNRLDRKEAIAHGSFVDYRLCRWPIRRYEDAKVGLLTHGLQYGTGCFEGIRGYWVPEERELLLVLVRDHYERLDDFGKDPDDVASRRASTS